MQADDDEWSPVNKVMKNFDSTVEVVSERKFCHTWKS